MPPWKIKIDDGSGNYTILTNAGSLGSDKTITIPNTTGTVALTSDTGSLTEADMWETSASISSTGVITTNLQRSSQTAFGYLGTGMTESSGIFTFPSTGYWLVTASACIQATTSDGATIEIRSTNDNFTSEDLIANMIIGAFGSGTTDAGTGVCSTIIDVTDTSNDKVKFRAGSITSGTTILGSTGYSVTSFKFLKLGDT